MVYLDIPADYARILTQRLLKQPRECIKSAYKGSPVDLAVLCNSLPKIPASLHAEVIDMFISHLGILQDGSEVLPVQLKLMDQSLRGIRVLMGSGHTPSAPIEDCSCPFTLASNWPLILDCAELILDADYDGACVGHDHLEKQISAVLHTATRVNRLAEQIHDPFGQRTARIASRLLMRQDGRAVAPWSNEETLLSLNNCDANLETLSYLLETFDGDLRQIIDTLVKRLRLLSKDVPTLEMVLHMDRLLFLIGQLLSAYRSRWQAPDNVNAYAAIAKSLLSIATAVNSPATLSNKLFRHYATIAIISGLMLYVDIAGYNNLPLAIALVRLGLFDVLLAVHSHIMQIMEPENQLRDLVELTNPIISQFLPEFLLYGSFVKVVVTSLRPLVEDTRLQELTQGPFGDIWVRFERLLLERYVVKKMWDTEAKHFKLHGICYNDSCEKGDLFKNFKKCSRCMEAQYCSTECQKVHWRNAHRLRCESPKLHGVTMNQQLRFERDKGLLAIIATSDIMRHHDSIIERALKRYPGITLQDTCFIVEYVKTPVSPDVQIQVAPIEGTQWTQYLHQNPHILADHYERRRLGKHSNLILTQCGFSYPWMEVLNTRHSLDSVKNNLAKAENLRTSAFDPDGTRLPNQSDMYEEMLRQVELARSKDNRWICRLENVGLNGTRHLDIFETVEVIHKYVLRV